MKATTEKRYKLCSDCKERKPLTYFPYSEKKFIRKNGEVSVYCNHKKYCKSCASLRSKQRKVARELMGKAYNNGTAVSLRAILGGIKRRMNQVDDMQMRFVYAQVGMEINNLLLKL